MITDAYTQENYGGTTMKQIIAGLVGVLCVYLLGAFFSVSFDISQWYEGARLGVTLFMPVGALTGLTAYQVNKGPV
jgi:hypothetical protein